MIILRIIVAFSLAINRDNKFKFYQYGIFMIILLTSIIIGYPFSHKFNNDSIQKYFNFIIFLDISIVILFLGIIIVIPW